ncbi:hypothetical protein [Frankia sp. CiP3]|uniref:hypothetical protein n=1 Tax=Frankia sp. CiP3 TaxID=2880971 RepID=UPI001EF603B1|nr:hypothetical protein [Frankia sp. CiP3]
MTRDPRWIVRGHDPKSALGAIRLIGYSPSAGFVLTVVVDSVDNAGITAWKTRGADLRAYLEGAETHNDQSCGASATGGDPGGIRR